MYYINPTKAKQPKAKTMIPTFTPTIKTEKQKSHNGFNYSEVSIDRCFGESPDVHFECNCSIFKTKKQVQDFIELVFN